MQKEMQEQEKDMQGKDIQESMWKCRLSQPFQSLVKLSLKLSVRSSGLALLAVGLLSACSGEDVSRSSTPQQGQTQAQSQGQGTLQIRANGEDFVRRGFVSKDGWEVSFDHVYVNLADITAYQTDPPFNPEGTDPMRVQQQVTLPGEKTVDLAAGDENAETILVGEVVAPAGRYNALSWRMANATEGPAKGYALVIVGRGVKDGQTVNFTLNLDREMTFTCGDFVGDERKGILEANGSADLEATFHFDHLFGDGDAPADDDLNTGALGFEPIAALSQNGQVSADLKTLNASFSKENRDLLEGILPSLGHVGEGHCRQS